MTDLEILRASMFDEIARLKRGTTTAQEAMTICKLANTIVSTYNTELKAIETMCKVQELGADTPAIRVFNESDNICVISAKNSIE